MKYIKFLVFLILLVWVVTAPFAMHARPGSMLYRLNVVVNEPVWEWLHITQQGRSEIVETQLANRYVELEQVWHDKVPWQQDWVVHAEDLTAGRTLDRLAGAISASDFKSADTLASHAIAITRAHKQVLTALVSTPGFGKTTDDILFMDVRLSSLTTLHDLISQRFATAYTKVELVRGVDAKMTELDQMVSDAQAAIASSDSTLIDSQRSSIQETLNRANALRAKARDFLAQDKYVEAYRYANLAEGYCMEINIVLTASQVYNLPISTPAVGPMPQ